MANANIQILPALVSVTLPQITASVTWGALVNEQGVQDLDWDSQVTQLFLHPL